MRTCLKAKKHGLVDSVIIKHYQETLRSTLDVTRFHKCDTTAADNEAICCKMANVQIVLSKI